jgi:tuftelin-interacting protein 11
MPTWVRLAHCWEWLQVFEPKEWASLTGRSILPKLAYSLDHEFTVNPVDQKLEPWEWAMAWSAVLPRSVYCFPY